MHTNTLLVLSLLSCTGAPINRDIAKVPPKQDKVEVKRIPVKINRNIDILWVVDNSKSMDGEQAALIANPTQGDLDPGTGGLRKVRIPDAGRGKGKRGGARVHYLYLPHSALIYLLFVYGKDELITLSAVQKKQLRRVVEAIRTEWEFRRR